MKIFAIILCLFAAMVLSMFIKNNMVPGGLGVIDGKLAPLPGSPNCVSTQTTDQSKWVRPLPFKSDLEASMKTIKSALDRYGNIEVITETADYIHAVSTSPLMRYKDDLEFYFDKSASVIHFRSASRIGWSDMGLNRTRYAKLAELYQ